MQLGRRDRSVVELLSARQMEMPGIERRPLKQMEQQKINETQQQPLGREFCVVDVVAAHVIYLFCCTIQAGVCVALTFPQNHNNSIYNELRWLISLMHASVWHLRVAHKP